MEINELLMKLHKTQNQIIAPHKQNIPAPIFQILTTHFLTQLNRTKKYFKQAT